MATDLHADERAKYRRKNFQLLDDPPRYPLRSSIWKIQKNSVNNNQDLMPQTSEIDDSSNSCLSIDKCQYDLTKLKLLIFFFLLVCKTQKCRLH